MLLWKKFSLLKQTKIFTVSGSLAWHTTIEIEKLSSSHVSEWDWVVLAS